MFKAKLGIKEVSVGIEKLCCMVGVMLWVTVSTEYGKSLRPKFKVRKRATFISIVIYKVRAVSWNFGSSNINSNVIQKQYELF